MAKSPVYGRGRNRKHRAPRGPFHAAAANINMKGKKSKLDSCWCCACIDFREDIQRKDHKKEITNYMRGVEQ
jgi:hypothetical protein